MNELEVVNEIVTLQQIHNDLGIIVCFLALFLVLFVFIVVYKALNNFFNL